MAVRVQRLRDRTAAKRNRRPKRESSGRRWLIAILLLLILLLLLWLCSCGPEPVETAGPAPPTREVVVPAPEVPPAPAPLQRTPRIDRPDYRAEPPGPPPWLTSFRMQVAARSPRLATCFEGTARPGALKWTTAVEAAGGSVSAHALEPMLLTDELTAVQKACVLGVLSEPPYRLQGGPDGSPDAPPSRVSLVIEF
jgi:hypothetical protein